MYISTSTIVDGTNVVNTDFHVLLTGDISCLIKLVSENWV
ncbi:hypothetical protein BTN50_0023 [Candidatus Enterovibrio altilux]|uniref:Uncharacterized protein n=1 Tax=Candidatus Enterovibrio altilux TaxID=1927128 RepID=A0A291B6E8_9GAMM|nr:hypothetical protein BTN50_0023 [Candidatus Enterovibrio luxaltus]